MKRIVCVIAAAAISLGVACGGREEPEFGKVTPDMPGGFELPAFAEAMPAYAVFPERGLRRGDLRKIDRIDAVTATAPIKVTHVEIEGPNGKIPLQLGSTQPLKFRSVAPASTREADFVWTSLIGGQAVVTYQAAEDLGVEGADRIGIPGLDGLRVGAFAENGTPANFADVLVSNHIIERMPGEPIDIVVVGTDEDADSEQVREALEDALPDAKLLPLVQVIGADSVTAGVAPTPRAQGSAEAGLGGTMNFTILDDGWIEPDDAWVEANITQATVPILGTVTCHRVMIPQLAEALAEIEAEGLAESIRPEDYAGCYAPRFIDRNPKLPLSNHAFGLAIDLNSDTNQLGTAGDMDPRVVEIFEKWGFEWGGHWERPDPMHFELARLLSPAA